MADERDNIAVSQRVLGKYQSQLPLGITVKPRAAQACSLYFVWNFGSELFLRLCMGNYQIFQNGRICAEMLK